MKELELDPVKRRCQMREMSHRFQHIFPRLSGETEDHVDNDLEAVRTCAAARGLLQPPVGILENLQGISAADARRCRFMDGLKAQFDPDGFAIADPQIAQHGEYLRRQAVGAGAQVEGDDLRVFKRFRVECAKAPGIAVGVGVGLEVSDVAAVFQGDGGRYFGVDARAGQFDLLAQGQKRSGKVTGAAFRAECAAAGADPAVAIGAAAAALERQPVYFGAEAGAHGLIER